METIELKFFSIFHALHKCIFNKTHLESVCLVYYCVLFSPTYLRLIWAAMMENHMQEETCMKKQFCILARMCNYTCIRLQQVLCIHYTYCLKLDGFKC